MKKRIFVLMLMISAALCGCAGGPAAESLAADGMPTLIIDPGHGGADGGAVAEDGSRESVINLSVSIRLDELCRLLGIKSVMTRRSEELEYPEAADTIRKMKSADQNARVELINSLPNAVLISIHQNAYPSPKIYGAQVLYSGKDGSRELAEIMQSNIAAHVGADNKRSAARISDDIYLMKKAECTAVLVECGFISNPGELQLLKEAEYQSVLASVILASYIQYISEAGEAYG